MNSLKYMEAAPDAPALPWMRYVAMLTGVLAALGGFLTIRSTNLSNEAIYHSSQGGLHQAMASDKWGEYQANSIKARIIETQLTVLAKDAPGRTELEAKDNDFRQREAPLRTAAEDEQKLRDTELIGGRARLSEKDTLAYAGMAVQLAIALASVAAMTRRKEAFVVAVVVGALGAGVTAYALIVHHFA